MNKKNYISILCVIVVVLILMMIARKTNNQEEIVESVEEEQNEVSELPLEPITIADAIEVTFVPQEVEGELAVPVTFEMCGTTIEMELPKRILQQKKDELQKYVHISEYEAPDGTLMARQRVGFKNNNCHYNIYVIGNLSDENVKLLAAKAESEYEKELLEQDGLSINKDGFHRFEKTNTTVIYAVSYQDETTEFEKYYFRYTDLENKFTVFMSIGLADADQQEKDIMKNSLENLHVTTTTFPEMEALAEQRNMHALYYCGRSYVYGYGVEQDYEKGFQLLLEAANAGNASSQNYIGYAYYNGNGVEQNVEEAVSWFQKAAELGNGEAMNNLGNRYYDGNGVTQDYEKAVYWYEKAIDAGNTTAYYNLANRYRYGDGVKQNKAKAIELYEQAAEAGIIQAYTRLANMYYDGEGVEQDQDKALLYFQIAANAGEQIAIEKLQEIQ